MLKIRPDYFDWLQQAAGDVQLVPVSTRSIQLPDRELIGNIEVFLGWCFRNVIEHGAQIRYFLNYGTGVDACRRVPAFEDRDFLMTNSQRVTGPSIAEHVIAMMLSMTRNLHHARDYQRKAAWEKRRMSASNMIEVAGKTMLIAGLGGIGTEVARRAHALGMRIVATRNTSRDGPSFVEYVGLADELYRLASQADVVVNSMPLTDENEGIFNKDFFRILKPGSYFISIGRGRHTDTDDLISALEDGTLAGAALDVTDPEPLPADHKLWQIANVIITPHVSAVSDRYEHRRMLLVRENLRRYVRGERLLNVVDLERGY